MSGDPLFIRYVEMIEERLGRLRGKERPLTPPEFALARRWYRAGVPIARVTQCLEEAGTEALSLTACRELIQASDRKRRQ
ncbi:MAG: hypothetical protein JXO72_09525 [Vicinamibacteria bacterium]|nr:hypothetical protein [Vicinamibacteria bacterium]